jgi:hypothetical protein
MSWQSSPSRSTQSYSRGLASPDDLSLSVATIKACRTFLNLRLLPTPESRVNLVRTLVDDTLPSLFRSQPSLVYRVDTDGDGHVSYLLCPTTKFENTDIQRSDLSLYQMEQFIPLAPNSQGDILGRPPVTANPMWKTLTLVRCYKR